MIPADAEGVEALVTTPALRVREEWSRDLEGLVVGDAVKRSVRLSAEQALGMLLPALEFEAPPGIATYADQPRVSDRIHRGQYRGERVEQVTYVLERPGEYRLPAIELSWWDPQEGRLVTERLEERSFEVAPSSGVAAVDAGGLDRAQLRDAMVAGVDFAREHLGLLVAAGLVGFGLVRVGRRQGPRVAAALGRARERRRLSERSAFGALERSVRAGDAPAVVRDYWAWRERLARERPQAAGAFEAHAQASGFAEAWSRFESARYGPSGAGEPGLPPGLLEGLRSLRARLRAAPEPGPEAALGALNPLR